MYPRILSNIKDDKKSYLLLGPRGTGKSTWLREYLRPDIYIDLLEDETYQKLLVHPGELRQFITSTNPKCIVIDEIQKVPALTDEVQRLIELYKWKFILTGSSARKLRKANANLLAGRAIIQSFYPLTALELGDDFNLLDSLQWGHLPAIFSEPNKDKFLKSYVMAYIKEELVQEGIIRNVQAFAKFLEAISFSQASILNVSNVAKDVGKDPKNINDYLEILEDLLMAKRLRIFSRKGTRKTITKTKFYFFDVGVYKSIRPSGPLDDLNGIQGHAFETLVFQEISALNDLLDWNLDISFWHTDKGHEVDFVLYGKNCFCAIETKFAKNISTKELNGLKVFAQDFPQAKLILVYLGDVELLVDNIRFVPITKFLKEMKSYIF